MASKQEKITALTDLMARDILTADEFTRIIAALDGQVQVNQVPEKEKTPAELAYEDYITNHIAHAFKSPSSFQFPPFDPSMVKEGTIELDGQKKRGKYIETYIDAPNSYGTMLREDIIIGIDNDFKPVFCAQHITRPLIGGKSTGWYRMAVK